MPLDPPRSDPPRMRNPFRSENTAFHFLLLTVAAFAVVATASAAGGTVAAIIAWAVVSAAAVALYASGRRERPAPEMIRHAGPPGERRIVVVAPLLASPLHRLANDVDAEQASASTRAAAVVRSLSSPHVHVSSAVGEDSMAAVDDALHTFGGNEILVLPGDDSLVERLRKRYALPVTQIDG